MDPAGRRIAVVMGGTSSEREISKMTGECVVHNLRSRYRVKPVEILGDGRWEVPRGYLGGDIPDDARRWFRGDARPVVESLGRLREDDVQVVFNALHGPGGEDGSFQGLLRHVGIPFTGPDVIPAAVTMDKCLTKDVLRGAGVETPGFARLPRLREVEWPAWVDATCEDVRLPWIVKPRCLGSSVGIEICPDAASFLGWLEATFLGAGSAAGSPPVEDHLVEELVRARELTCGVVETDGEARALPPIEIRPKTSSFFDYHAKYTPGATDEICPAPLDAEVTERAMELAVRVHRLFDCEPISRTDFFLLDDDTLTVIEVNTLPGMTATSLIPLSASEAGISLEELFASLVDHALRRDARSAARLRC